MIVVDASVFAFSLLDDGATGGRCRGALVADDRWIVPQHWTIEVMSVIRGNLLGGKITADHAADAVEALRELDPVVPLTRVLLPRVWELRSHLTAYDAAYVAAAELYGCPLLTTDGRMARAAGIRCAVEVVG
ncbi:type II toxin-antitoxin system VapC family toxin [Streptomyces sp. NPDC046977]|uniref:type II toxin-antitoxin system VapC family toxin n=1 Tax=Streptomyces sp. NPDC046977 TaxID=3154703 RepID=UPI0033EBC993